MPSKDVFIDAWFLRYSQNVGKRAFHTLNDQPAGITGKSAPSNSTSKFSESIEKAPTSLAPDKDGASTGDLGDPLNKDEFWWLCRRRRLSLGSLGGAFGGARFAESPTVSDISRQQ